MRITAVRQEKLECGIPLKGLDSVKTALQTFSKGERPTVQKTASQIEEGNGLGALLFLSFLPDAGDRFLQQLFSELEIVKGRGYFERSFDYDGRGPFFKTTVEVSDYGENDIYILGLHAAYVGRQVEERLAEMLGAERGLQWLKVSVETEPVGEQFQFDFNEIAAGIKPLFGSPETLSGEAMVTAITSFGDFGNSGRFVFQTGSGLTVSVFPDDVSHPFQYMDRQKKAAWISNGAKLSGPLRESYTERGKFRSSKIAISIFGSKKGSFERLLPIIDPAVKEEARSLADKIEAAFRP